MTQGNYEAEPVVCYMTKQERIAVQWTITALCESNMYYSQLMVWGTCCNGRGKRVPWD